jgi:hypothetical protein
MDDSGALFDASGLKRVEPFDNGGFEIGAGIDKRFRPFEPDAMGLDRVHSRVDSRECSYAAMGVGSQGWPVGARVMASSAVSPWLRADVR